MDLKLLVATLRELNQTLDKLSQALMDELARHPSPKTEQKESEDLSVRDSVSVELIKGPNG